MSLDDLTTPSKVLCHLGDAVRIARLDEVLRRVRDVGEHDRHGGHRSSLVDWNDHPITFRSLSIPAWVNSMRSSGEKCASAEWVSTAARPTWAYTQTQLSLNSDPSITRVPISALAT